MLHANATDSIARVKQWGSVWGVWRGQNVQRTFPKLPPNIEAGIRKCLAKRFPILLRFFTKTFFGKAFFPNQNVGPVERGPG